MDSQEESGRRLNVLFSVEARRTLEELARQKGKSLSETLRDAVAHEKWLQDTQDAGARILVDRDGALYEIVRL